MSDGIQNVVSASNSKFSLPVSDALADKAAKNAQRQLFVDGVQKATKAIFNSVEIDQTYSDGQEKPADANNLSKPILAEPTEVGKRALGNQASFTALLGRLITLLSQSSLQFLESRSAFINSLRVGKEKIAEEVTKEFALGTVNANDAIEVAKNATKELIKAQQTLDFAQAELAKFLPSDLGFNAAQKNFNNANDNLKLAQENAIQATAFASKKNREADDYYIAHQSTVATLNNSSIYLKAHSNNLSSLIAAMVMLANLLSESAKEKLQNELELFQKIQKARAEALDRQATELAQQMDKAAVMKQVMGCIGKILGALLVVVGFALAETGVGLAIAAIGLALFVVDTVVELSTGKSLMDRALGPVMEKVIQPLIDVLAKGITELLKAAGINANDAETAGKVIAMAVVAVVLVVLVLAVAVVGPSVAGKLAGSLSNLIAKMVSEQAGAVVRNFLTGTFSNTLAQSTLKYAPVAVGGAAATAQAANAISQGVMQYQVKNKLADMSWSREGINEITRLLAEAEEAFSISLKKKQNILVLLSERLQSSLSAATSVARAVGRVSHV